MSIIFSLAVTGPVKPVYSQSPERDTTFHPYHVDYWVTGGILVAGIAAEKIGVKYILDKPGLTNAELQTLDRTDFTAIDRWALELDPSNMNYYLDVLLMYSETILIP